MSERRVLRLTDIHTGTFKPHIVVPIPELAEPGDAEPPCVYLVSPSAGRVLEIGATKMNTKRNKEGELELDAATVEQNSTLMVSLVQECARTEDGEPLCKTSDDVRKLPVFIFNRLVKALNSLMLPGEVDAAGKGSTTTPGVASPTS